MAGEPSRERLWGRQTELAVANFPISGTVVDRRVIEVLGHVKAAAAEANASSPEVGLDRAVADAIVAAATEVAEGRWDDQFPVDVYQTGSGTSTNMNANEVIARLATDRTGLEVHPNDHVNASQSSNDVMPTVVRLATALALRDDVLPALDGTVATLRRQARRHATTVTAGRTHLMDAAPLFMGQQFDGWASQLESCRAPLEAAVDVLRAVPLGGTAVGTGLNVPEGWIDDALEELATRLRMDVVATPDRFAAQGGGEAYQQASAALRGLAVAATKVANDVRLLGSGPFTGIGELRLPELQAGSSMMPGKVNPVLCEAVIQVGARVVGNDATVAVSAAGGILQLNTFQPLVAHVLGESARLLAAVLVQFDRRCLEGIEVDVDAARAHATASPALITGLAARIGYDRATALVRRAVAEERPLAEVVRADPEVASMVDPSDLDRALDPERLARGGLA